MEPLTSITIFFGGLFAGILNTIVGGGSLLSIPLLIISGLPTNVAIATNRFSMIFNSGFGAIEYYKRENYNILFSIFLTFSASAGSLIGANIVLQFDEVLLKYFISVLMLLMGCIIFFKKELGLKRKRNQLNKKKYTAFVLLSFILGVYGGFYGAGVSTLFSFMFVSFLGISFLNSAGTTRLIVTGLSTIAALVFFLNNMINFLYGLILALSFIIGAKIGVRLAFEAGNMWIRRFMIILVIISSIKLILF